MITRILNAVRSTPWAIIPASLRGICEVLALRSQGVKFTAEEITERLAVARSAAASRPKAQEPGFVAVIPVHGVILNRADSFDEVSGMVGCETISSMLRRAAADPDVKAILFDFDSPGGMVSGVPELAAEIAACPKYTVAVANQLCASAAYWLMAQCDDVVCSPSGEVGSIGVVSIHEDLSKAYDAAGVGHTIIKSSEFKYEGNPYEPLSDEAKSQMQADINAFDGMFVKDVAKGRGVSMAKVRADFGQGRTLLATDALKAGMIDRVGTIRQVAKDLGGQTMLAKRERMAVAENPSKDALPPPIVAKDVADVAQADPARKIAWLQAGGGAS